MQALTKNQLELAKVKLELRHMTAKYQQAQVELKQKQPSQSSSSKQQQKPTKILGDEERISLHARKFSVMNEPFISNDAFLKARPIDVRSDNPRRWDTPESALRGLIAELYEEVPRELHSMIEKHTRFRDLVWSITSFLL